MKKLIIGCVLIQLLSIEPIIGWYIFGKYLQIPDGPLIFSAVTLGISMILQMFSYGSLVVSGFKELKIEHAFHGSDDRKEIRGQKIGY